MKKTKKRPGGRSSISRELILGTGVPILLIFVQVLLMLSLVMGMQITPTVDENLKFKATAVKDEVNMFLNQFADMTEEYANDTYLQDFMYNAAVTGTYYADMPNAEYIFSHLEASANMYPGIINEYYANSGWLLNDLISSARDTCHTDYPDEDMINSDWMNAVVEGDGETVFINPYYDPTTGLNVCTVASPIYRQGKLLGMLGIDITLDIADKIFADATIDETGYSIAILSDGTVYYHPDTELKDKNVEDIGLPEEILQLYRDKDYDTVVTAKYGDKKVVATVEGIGNTGWSMIMLQDRSEAYRVVKHTTVFLVICLAIALILISLVLLVITRRMAKPVKALVEEAGKLANGDLVTNNCEYDENPHDELDDLMNAFSQLVDSSRKQAEVMDKLAKGNLNMEIQPRSENDLMNISIQEMTETMNTLGAEVNKMTENALLGNTAYRADIGSLQGGYADLIMGINATVDNIMAAVDTLRNAMVDIGNGVMPELSYDAKGDYIEAVQAIETTKATIATLTEQVNGMAATVATGSFSDPVDENVFKGEFKTLIHGINETLRMVVEKAGWYESILNSIPMPVEVMDNDANWTLVNTAMAAPMIQSGRITDMKQLYGQHCEMGDVEINGVPEFTQSHITDKTIKAFGRTYNRQTSELLDIYGKRAGFVTTFADLTDVMRQAEYSINEVNRIEQNMKSLAQGNFEMVHSTQETDEIVMHLAEQYGRIDASIEEVVKAVEDLIKDIKDATGKAVAGDLANRITAETHAGEFGDVARGVNDIIDAITEPIEESLKVLEEMEKGNLQMKVTGDYQGDHAKMKNAINNSLKSLNEVIGDITITLANIGKGDLDPHDYGVVYTGDFMDISDSLDEIRFNLIDIMIKLSESSHQVAVGSKQLAEGASTLAAGSTKQSTAVQELSATMEQVAEQTRGNAKDARKASEMASDVMRKAEEGNAQMQSMLQSMKDINESSANISKIIKVIDDIAFQTNILALNAAVEAARAGVHGKGFAVVADEVRSLAAKSAAAASETTSLIEGSIVKVEAGTKIANKTAEALEEIVAGVTETAGLCNTIADVSEGQQEGIDQVNIGIGEISDVITENSATAEESAASSEELYGQTDTLKSLVDLFEFKEKYSLNLETSSTKAISGGVQNETPMISLDIDISDKY